jgi:catechol 2,3-dioxygenase-like lactoylglutathione lyase family enzyme
MPADDGTVLDHVGLFVPDMARAARAMEDLGFALTPYTPQRHALATGELAPTGTANRLAILQHGYIEILTAIGDTPLASQMRRAIGRYAGAHLIAFGSADAEATHRRLAKEGFDPLPLVRLQRGAITPDGERLARLSVVRVPPERMPEGRMQFCRHHTPELVWQPRIRTIAITRTASPTSCCASTTLPRQRRATSAFWGLWRRHARDLGSSSWRAAGCISSTRRG